MKRKGTKKEKKAQKAEDDSNGVEEQVLEENGGASEDAEVEAQASDAEEEPQEKKRKSKSNKRNVSFSKKGSENDEDEGKKQKKKKGKGAKKAETESEEEEEAAAAADDQDEDTETQYEVEKVLDEKMLKGVRHYLIRWKGYEEESDTWEPEDTLNCANLIEAFKETKKKSAPKKRKGKKVIPGGPKVKEEEEPEEWDENEDFEVDKILEVHHKRNGQREFLVVWKGYSSKDSSWEPEENMNCKDLIEKFMSKVEKAKNLDEKELRQNRKHVQRLTYNPQSNARRLSRRNTNKERVQYHDTD